MALTTAQKADVVFYLGWPAKSLQTDSTHYNPTLDDRLTNLPSDAESQVTTLLGEISTLRSKFTASSGRMLVKKVGDIELNTGEHEKLREEQRRLIRDLALVLDIPQRKVGGVNVGVVV